MTYDSAPFGALGHLILFSPVARFILLMLTDFISSANTVACSGLYTTAPTLVYFETC